VKRPFCHRFSFRGGWVSGARKEYCGNRGNFHPRRTENGPPKKEKVREGRSLPAPFNFRKTPLGGWAPPHPVRFLFFMQGLWWVPVLLCPFFCPVFFFSPFTPYFSLHFFPFLFPPCQSPGRRFLPLRAKGLFIQLRGATHHHEVFLAGSGRSPGPVRSVARRKNPAGPGGSPPPLPAVLVIFSNSAQRQTRLPVTMPVPKRRRPGAKRTDRSAKKPHLLNRECGAKGQ